MKALTPRAAAAWNWHSCALPHFGETVTWVLLSSCLLLVCSPFETVVGERQGPASLLAWLPERWLYAPVSFYLCRALLLLGTVLWFAKRALPWSCWLTTISFTALWSLHMETTTNGAHICHVGNQLLIVQSLWITLKQREIAAALRAGRYWQTPLYPHWAFWLGLGFLGLFHTLAGLAKICHSGADWANGTSLQLWAYWDGRPGSFTRELIINHKSLAQLLQWATLIFETAGILALFDRRLRVVIGLALVSFYLGVVLTFDYGFHLNLVLTALYHFPCDAWLTPRANPLPAAERESAAEPVAV